MWLGSSIDQWGSVVWSTGMLGGLSEGFESWWFRAFWLCCQKKVVREQTSIIDHRTTCNRGAPKTSVGRGGWEKLSLLRSSLDITRAASDVLKRLCPAIGGEGYLKSLTQLSSDFKTPPMPATCFAFFLQSIADLEVEDKGRPLPPDYTFEILWLQGSVRSKWHANLQGDLY